MQTRATPTAPAPAGPGRVAVLGGGDDARMLAAIALSEGAEVALFSAYGAELSAMRQAGGIALRGAGPIGSYQLDAENAPSVKTTAEIDTAVAGADTIFLTGPVHKQRTYAMVLADHLRDGQTLVLTPGRTFGALETRWLLSIGGCAAQITVVEAAPPFWFAADGGTLHLSEAAEAAAGSLPVAPWTLSGLLPNSAPAVNVLASSFADGSGLVEAPALILGGPAVADGGPKVPMGGQPLAENATFRNLLGPEHTNLIHALAEERRATARAFGVRDLPDATRWIDIHAGAPSGAGARPIPAREAAHGILRDAAVGSLVPLLSAAAAVGVPAPVTEAMVAQTSAILKADLKTAGRSLPGIGIHQNDADAARKALETRAKGA